MSADVLGLVLSPCFSRLTFIADSLVTTSLTHLASYTAIAQAREDNWLVPLVLLFVAVLETDSHSVAQATLSCFSFQSAGTTGVHHSTRQAGFFLGEQQCSKDEMTGREEKGDGKSKYVFYLDHYQLLVNVYHTHKGNFPFHYYSPAIISD